MSRDCEICGIPTVLTDESEMPCFSCRLWAWKEFLKLLAKKKKDT